MIMRLLEVAPARASGGMMRRGRNQIKRDAGTRFVRQPIPFGEIYGSTIAEMQIDRAAVSIMNGAHRKPPQMVLRAFSHRCFEIG
jgi:hypothetical protein